jgi:exopolysaccharide biosynthesis protein
MIVRVNKLMISLLLMAAVSLFSCEKTEVKLPGDVIVAPEPEIPVDVDPNPTTTGWTLETTKFGNLPDYIKVYKAPAQLENKNAVAYIAIANMNKTATFILLGDAKGYKTPTEFYESSDKKDIVVMNAGYFWEGSSLSLLYRDNQLICPNNQVEYRSDANGNDIHYFPTRGVFGLMNDGSYKVNWVYTNDNKTYAYPAPAPNKSGATPLQMPSATYPENGIAWNAKIAIGGGPILIKNGECKNTYEAELFDVPSGIGPTSNNPRSAIGITKGGKLIFFVCEGRNMTPNVPGYTLEEVAKIMKSIGCVEALNLDGGGSSCMLINGIETIKPSDGTQRKVVTGVGIK